MKHLPEQTKSPLQNAGAGNLTGPPDEGLVFELVVHANDHGRRIDAFLAKHFRNYTTFRLHRLVAAGLVKVDQLHCEVTQRVFRSQSVRIHLVEPPDKLLAPEQLPVRVLYEDPWMLVVDKPAGMVVHPIGEFQSGTLCNAIQNHLDRGTIAAGLLRPGIVHRLDRMTSGLLAVAKTSDMHTRLSSMIQDGRFDKQYLALIHGHPTFEDRVIDKPIGAVSQSSILMSVAPDSRNPRTARTDVKVLKKLPLTTLVQCRLHTGRNHQIRVHLASIGHPVVGDEFYRTGNRVTSTPEALRDLSVRHALHAAALQFDHPVLNQRVIVKSPPTTDFWMMLAFSSQQDSTV